MPPLIRDHRAALLAALAQPPDPASVFEFYEERAAVFVFDAGLSRAEAAALRRTLEHFALPGPGAGGVDTVLARLGAVPDSSSL